MPGSPSGADAPTARANGRPTRPASPSATQQWPGNGIPLVKEPHPGNHHVRLKDRSLLGVFILRVRVASHPAQPYRARHRLPGVRLEHHPHQPCPTHRHAPRDRGTVASDSQRGSDAGSDHLRVRAAGVVAVLARRAQLAHDRERTHDTTRAASQRGMSGLPHPPGADAPTAPARAQQPSTTSRPRDPTWPVSGIPTATRTDAQSRSHRDPISGCGGNAERVGTPGQRP